MITNLKLTKIFLFISLTLMTALFTFSSNESYASNSEDELFLVTQKAFEDGFYDVAIRYIQQLLQDYPHTDKHVQAELLLGQCYFFKNQYLKSYEIFQRLLKYDEYKDATLFWLGETYLKGADYKQAQKQYKQLIEIYPNSVYTPQATYSLGWSYFEQNKLKKAKEIFQKLVLSFPTHQLSEDAAFKLGESEYNLKNYNDTIEYFKQFIVKFTKSTKHSEAYFYIAESYYYLEKPLEAIRYYSKSADIAYDNKLILMCKVSLGWSYLKLNKYELAQKFFDEARSISEEKGILSDDVYLGQATLYSATKKHEEALKSYIELIEKFPNSKRVAEAHLGKANIYYQFKNYKKAIVAYQIVIDRFSNDPSIKDTYEKAYFGLAWSYLKSGDIDSSIKIFRKIENQASNNIVKISALTQIGDAYQDINQHEKAIDIYDNILNRYPNSPYIDYVQYRQGIALLKLDKIDAARLSFQSLAANFPESKYLNEVDYYLAVAYFKKEDWKNTIDKINSFKNSLNPSDNFLIEADYIHGLSLYNLKQYNEAINIFQSLLANNLAQKAMIKSTELNIAKCLYKLKQFEKALSDFRTLITKYPTSEVAQESIIWLGDHYLENAEFDQAIEAYEKFIEKFPGSDRVSLVYYELGRAFEAKKDFANAVNAFKQINNPKDKELFVKAKLAIADIFSKKMEPEAAFNTYENIIQSSPEFKRDAYANLARLHRSLKNYDKAVAAFKDALASEKKMSHISDAELQFYVGDTFELLNNTTQAVEEYIKIPYLYPKDTQWIIKAYLRSGRIFEDTERWNEAKITYKKIINYNTDEVKFAQERIEWIEKKHGKIKNKKATVSL